MAEAIAVPRTVFFDTCLAVFQGGGCRAAAFAGAYEAAHAAGVRFSEVAGTSAGSILAALIGAGGSPQWVREKIEDLVFHSLMKPPQPQDGFPGFRGAAGACRRARPPPNALGELGSGHAMRRRLLVG